MPRRRNRAAPGGSRRLVPHTVESLRRAASPGGLRRLGALLALTLRESIRSRLLLGMAALMALFGAGALLWPADQDAARVILVQRFCFGSMTFFGLIAAAFLGGSALPQDITTKRIYSIATKPVSRLELLLGKSLGLMAVAFLFLLCGGLISACVIAVANARKTYEGGSYTLEVTAPGAQIRTPSGPVEVKRGQVLVANRKEGNAYIVTLAGRDESYEGPIAASDVELHVRSLSVQRVAPPDRRSTRCEGAASYAHNELLLWCSRIAPNDTWMFDVSELAPPRTEADLHVRLRFKALLHEPVRGGSFQRELPEIGFRFANPQTGESAHRSIRFTYPGAETRPVPERGQPADFYEEVFTLPRTLIAGGRLNAHVLDYTPVYPPSGRVSYNWRKTPTWTFRGFDPADLPQGRQTLTANFLVHNARGLDLIDNAKLTAVLRNPATGEEEAQTVHLRNQTTSVIHFDRRLIDPERGVELTLQGISESQRIGHYSKDAPVYLVLTPGSFWASTARSVFLIFLQLALFTVLAVAASTFLSAPVAIFLTLVAALAGAVKDLMLETLTAAQLAPPWLASGEAATLRETLWQWIEWGLRQVLVYGAPGFQRFSSADYVNRGWAVPWSAVWDAAGYALVYGVFCFAVGYVLLWKREFE
jgi:hypothetical protein